MTIVSIRESAGLEYAVASGTEPNPRAHQARGVNQRV